MKKTFIAAVVTLGFIGNALAECEQGIYNAPVELQPACANETVTAPDAQPATLKNEQQQATEHSTESKRTDSASARVLSAPNPNAKK